MPETEEEINSFQDILYIDKDYEIGCSNKLVYNSLFQTDNTYSDYSLKKIPLLERKIANNMYKYVFKKLDEE